MNVHFEYNIPIPLTLIGCSIAFFFAGAHLNTPWTISFGTSLVIDLTVGLTLKIKTRKKSKDDEWGNSSQP